MAYNMYKLSQKDKYFTKDISNNILYNLISKYFNNIFTFNTSCIILVNKNSIMHYTMGINIYRWTNVTSCSQFGDDSCGAKGSYCYLK